MEFENEDVILPDDFQEAPPQATEETLETPETPVDDGFDIFEPEQTEELTTDIQEEAPLDEQPRFKVKYNHEEQEIAYDDAVPLIQKGMNFDKAVERARQEARDAVIAEQGYEWNGKAITSEAEYKQALQEQEWMQQYQNQNLPEEVVQELIEGRKFREQSQAERQEKAQQEQQTAEFRDFFNYFRELNGRDYVHDKDQIPQEVWEAQAQGVPLKYAYLEHHSKQLKTQLQTVKKNEENTLKAPVGSLSAHGSTETAVEDDFLRGFNSI